MKKYLGTCRKYSFMISAAALVLYVLIEAADSIIGAFRGRNLFDFGVIFNIALVAAGVLILFRQVKFASIPLGVAAVVNLAWLFSYTGTNISALLNYGFDFTSGYLLGIFSVLFEYAKSVFGMLAMIALGVLCVLAVLGRLPRTTMLWYAPAAFQAVAFVIALLEGIISLIKLLFGSQGELFAKLGYVYDFGSDAVMGIILFAAVAFTGLAVNTYTMLPTGKR